MRRARKCLAGLPICAAVWMTAAPATAAGAIVGAPVRSSYIYKTHRPNPDEAANAACRAVLSSMDPGAT